MVAGALQLNVLVDEEARVASLRAAELASLNSARTTYDSSVEAFRAAKASSTKPDFTIKSLGPKPKLVRTSSCDAALILLRQELARAANFNLGSSQQKAWLLYDKLGLKALTKKRSKEGDSTTTTEAKELTKLLRRKLKPELKEIIELIISYAEPKHTLNTFIKACYVKKDFTCSIADRLHPAYGLHRTSTGRIASGSDTNEKSTAIKVNAQNQPKEVRDMYIADNGYVFVGFDWKGLENLIVFWLAGDVANFNKFAYGLDKNGIAWDAHRTMAAELFGMDYYNITKPQRELAKKGRHAINYTAGPTRIANEMGVELKLAKALIEADHKTYPLVAKWREEVVAEAHRQRYLETPFGWRRDGFYSKEPQYIGEIVSTKPQGIGGDMCKIRLPDVAAAAHAVGGWPAMTVHDYIGACVPEGTAVVFEKSIKAIGEAPFRTLGNLSFPVDTFRGVNWLAAS